ncbi:MAG TPA: hypothetical protein VKS22_11230 [Candidatus Binataceae bacterium]|nr:hypothetical protein [Candidatus Binataceae bacterium]
MNQIVYAMQFKGSAAPKAGVSGVILASTTAPSCKFSSVVGPSGVTSTLQPLPDGTASFESEVTLTGETSFIEAGTIRFGESSHLLRFSTVGQGFLGKSPDAALQHGSVMWRVEGGEGQFAGASGLITSNFTLSTTGEVTDNHFGLIFVR